MIPRLFTGTSGYSFAFWKGPFYPEKIAAAKMLGFYAERLNSVELNNTYYRLPKTKTVETWRQQVPMGFRFALKASKRITHEHRLKEGCHDTVDYMFATVEHLGDGLGPVLFQLPPTLKLNLERLKVFLSWLPRNRQVAFEFRHDSWFEPRVIDALRDAGAALCIADTDAMPEPDLTKTTSWTYVRLRRENYDDAQLASFAQKIKAAALETAYVYFQHEDDGAAPALAQRFTAIFGPQGDR